MTEFILRVSSRFGLFTRPELKVERYSYDVITPSAARGILEAIYWKPQIRWVIDEIHVLSPIRFQSVRRNEVKRKASTTLAKRAMASGSTKGAGIDIDRDRTQRASSVLVAPDYLIKAHFDLTGVNSQPGDTATKHAEIFTRRALRGQCFHMPCMGTREFPADFALIPPGSPLPAPIEDTRDLGIMLWDVDYTEKSPMFFRAKMDQGIVAVPALASGEVLM